MRAPPPVTVVVPGRGAVPGELLAVGPPADESAPRGPVPRSRWVALAAVVVLGAGVVQVATYDVPPAAPAVPPPPVSGVTAAAVQVRGLVGGPLVERFGLTVEVALRGGRGDSGSPSEQDAVSLLGVTGRGFFLELVGAALPLEVPLDRTGGRLALEATAQVSDCAIDSQAQRTLELQVQQGARTGEVKVAVDGDVVRLLDRLVARSCRRPRG